MDRLVVVKEPQVEKGEPDGEGDEKDYEEQSVKRKDRPDLLGNTGCGQAPPSAFQDDLDADILWDLCTH